MEVSQQAETGMNENKTEEEVEICLSGRYCFEKSRLSRTVKFQEGR
jgi:hypothetical protein